MGAPRWLMLLSFCTLISACFAFAQPSAPTREEERNYQVANLAWARALSVGSVEALRSGYDTVAGFLRNYPHSLYRYGVFAYACEIAAHIPGDSLLVEQLGDSMLVADSSHRSRQWLGDLLIRTHVDDRRGAELLRSVMGSIAAEPAHLADAYVDLGIERSRAGDVLEAERWYRAAIGADSTRSDAWFLYLALAKAREDRELVRRIESHLEAAGNQDEAELRNESNASPLLNKPLTGVILHDRQGRPLRLSSLEGKVLLINIFAYWCGACRMELPVLDSMSREFPAVAFLYVVQDDDPGDSEDQLNQEPFRFLRHERLLRAEGKLLDDLKVDAVPRTLILDRSGKIRFSYRGYAPRTSTLFRESLNRLLTEK